MCSLKQKVLDSLKWKYNLHCIDKIKIIKKQYKKFSKLEIQYLIIDNIYKLTY